MALTPCCNPWNSTVQSECGTFEEPAVADQGQCHTYRVKRDCAPPALPVAQCADDSYETLYDPEDQLNPFKVSAKLFDENCEAITDESADPITLILT